MFVTAKKYNQLKQKLSDALASPIRDRINDKISELEGNLIDCNSNIKNAGKRKQNTSNFYQRKRTIEEILLILKKLRG